MYKGKIVIVTGASRGIGLEIAKHFVKNNATVIGLSRSASSINHPCFFHFPVDLGNPDEITDCFRKKITKQFKHIDIVVNNAAVLTSQYSMIMPVKNAIEMVNVNLLGVFFVSREAAKLMRNRKYGRIVNIGSMATSLEPMGDSIYAATKSGTITLANTMAKEFSSINVTCNTLAVTAFDSEMLRVFTEPAKEKVKNIIKNLPVPRMAETDDILNVLDFFCSERSSYITAQTIYLGGIN